MRRMAYAVLATWLFGLATQASAALLSLGSGTFSTTSCKQGCSGTFSPGTAPAEAPPGVIDDDYLFTITGGAGVGLISTFALTHAGPPIPVLDFSWYPGTPQHYPEGSQIYSTETSSSSTSQTYTLVLNDALYPGQYFLHVIYDSSEYPPAYSGTYSFTPETHGHRGPHADWTSATDLAGLSVIAGQTVTPLPATLPLFATGLGALGLLGWRRKQRARSIAA